MARTPTLSTRTLQQLGITERDYTIYVTLLKLGTAPLRRIAQECDISRSTVHDTLRRLMDLGLVRHLDAQTHRYFTPEEPRALRALATRREVDAQEAREKVQSLLPELEGLLGRAQHRPAVHYFEGSAGIKTLLQDVLEHTAQSKEKLYRVYSSMQVRDLIAASWPSWNQARKRRKVSTRAIAIGEGGSTYGMDERKWLSKEAGAPTYIFIYGNRTAYVAADTKKQLFGVTIEDAGITQSQRLIFDALWKAL